MTTPYTEANLQLDGNGRPIQGIYPFVAKKSITFAGATADAWGNDGGALDGGTVFTVTGAVKLIVFGKCSVNLAGGATLEMGITGATAIFLPQTTDTDVDAGDIWLNNATPVAYYIAGAESDAAGNLPEYILNGQDIILTVSGGTDTTAGQVDFYAHWLPLSSDGNVVAA